MSTLTNLITPAAAFVLGFALARANSCTVASARRLVVTRRADWLIGLAIAICWAGVTLMLFAALQPQVVVLPAQAPLAPGIFIGGVLMGIGATLNRGCFLGSVAGLGRGDLSFVATLGGIALAMHLAPSFLDNLGMPVAPARSGFRTPGALLFAGALFAPVALFGLFRWWKSRRAPLLALMVVGIAGGTVYACNPNWSYSAGLYRLSHSIGSDGIFLAEFGSVAAIAGVVISAVTGGRFAFRRGKLIEYGSRLGGGMLMGSGAMLVPGGNDTLMLWAIPGLTYYGPIAYATMISTIILLITLRQARYRGTEETDAASASSG